MDPRGRLTAGENRARAEGERGVRRGILGRRILIGYAAANTVTVQLACAGRGAVGSSVYVWGPPAKVKARSPAPQSIENADGPAVTGSLNVTLMVVAGATPVLPLAGTVWVTLGAASPGKVCPVLQAPNVLGMDSVAQAKSA